VSKYRVYSFQIDPRKKYHSTSLSLREYSVRSRTEAAGAVRRRLREITSMTIAVIRGRLESSFVADKVAKTSPCQIDFGT
jgi:hypothetical protein